MAIGSLPTGEQLQTYLIITTMKQRFFTALAALATAIIIALLPNRILLYVWLFGLPAIFLIACYIFDRKK